MNEQEEKILLTFLETLGYKYQNGVSEEVGKVNTVFLEKYNDDIQQADAEIVDGNYVKQADVEKLFRQRRKVF
ncbi:MAG TPA: hypothetical protein VK541_08350 [Pedobacter sp.]|uniref:hypothetical protein n=1 Tax=Pedobacter sp. TaxID=1411316 RepID=UPI002B660029|nr:hypothetical protein [Pedobacter sp.]HMI02476.1 hypothetical protein [Pedobacter sp.]